MNKLYKIFIVSVFIFLSGCFSQAGRKSLSSVSDPSTYEGLHIFYNGSLLSLCDEATSVNCYEVYSYNANNCDTSSGDYFIAYDNFGNSYCMVYVPEQSEETGLCEDVVCRVGTTCVRGFCVGESNLVYNLEPVVIVSPGNSDPNTSTETVETPVFSPAPGFYNTSGVIQVSISTATSDADIFYTLDGSNPNCDTSFLYTSPILIQGESKTIKAIACKDEYYDSNIFGGDYIVQASNSCSGACSNTGATLSNSDCASGEVCICARGGWTCRDSSYYGHH